MRERAAATSVRSRHLTQRFSCPSLTSPTRTHTRSLWPTPPTAGLPTPPPYAPHPAPRSTPAASPTPTRSSLATRRLNCLPQEPPACASYLRGPTLRLGACGSGQYRKHGGCTEPFHASSNRAGVELPTRTTVMAAGAPRRRYPRGHSTEPLDNGPDGVSEAARARSTATGATNRPTLASASTQKPASSDTHVHAK
jgi:hypothetical protein